MQKRLSLCLTAFFLCVTLVLTLSVRVHSHDHVHNVADNQGAVRLVTAGEADALAAFYAMGGAVEDLCAHMHGGAADAQALADLTAAPHEAGGSKTFGDCQLCRPVDTVLFAAFLGDVAHVARLSAWKFWANDAVTLRLTWASFGALPRGPPTLV